MRSQECERCGAPTWTRLCGVCAGRHASGRFICCGGYGSHVDGCELVGHINQQRFWDRVAVADATECWLWQGYVRPNGYGQFGRNRAAHRVSYELTFGPIPTGLTIDHLCVNPRCVNPNHLEAVTLGENVRRSVRNAFRLNERKTHCKVGHLYDEENTYTDPQGRRHCRACDRPRKQAYKARMRGATA